MGIMSWLTGRNEKESDVYANYDKVSIVTDKISTIVADMSSSIETIDDAVVALNSCNGVGEYVVPVDVSVINEVLNSFREQIAKIGTDITTKAESIKTYEEASWLEKGASTFTMVGAKVLEGSLKVFEDMGDGIVSVVGWVAPKDSGLEKACETFVEKDLSHDAFNAYYNSEFAKKSLITEDSGVAFLSKLAGQTCTFIFLGKGISKVAGNLSKSESSLLRSVGAFAKSEKKLDVLQASLEGMGVGTSDGLQKGLSMDEAAGGGVKQAALQGAIAWGVGSLVEKGKEIYKAKRAVHRATGTAGKPLVLASGSGTADDLVNGSTKIFNSSEDAASRVVSQTDETFEGIISGNVDNVMLGQGDEAAEFVIKNADDVGEGAATQFQGFITGTIDDDIEVLGDDVIEVVSKKTSGAASHIDDVILKQSDDVLRLVSKGDEATELVVKNADDVGKGATAQFRRSGVDAVGDSSEYVLASSKNGSIYAAGSRDSAGVFRSSLDYSQEAAIKRIEEQTGVKITMVDDKLIPGTNLPVSPVVEIDGTKYYFSSNLVDGGKVNGASKHIFEHINKTLEPEYVLNPNKLDDFLGKPGFSAASNDGVRMQELYAQYKNVNGITGKLTSAQKADAMRLVSDANITLTDMKKNLAHAGIHIDDLSGFTPEQLTQINGEAVMKVYVDGIKDYHAGKIFDGSLGTVEKVGVPTWINPSKAGGDNSYLIEMITRPVEGEPGSYFVFHLDHKSGAIPLQQAARQQGAKMLTDGVAAKNLQYNIVEQAISEAGLPNTWTDFLADKGKYLSQITSGMQNVGVQKVTTGSNMIADAGLRSEAIDAIKTIMQNSDTSALERIIKMRYEGNTSGYIDGLSKFGKALAKAAK